MRKSMQRTCKCEISGLQCPAKILDPCLRGMGAPLGKGGILVNFELFWLIFSHFATPGPWYGHFVGRAPPIWPQTFSKSPQSFFPRNIRMFIEKCFLKSWFFEKILKIISSSSYSLDTQKSYSDIFSRERKAHKGAIKSVWVYILIKYHR